MMIRQGCATVKEAIRLDNEGRMREAYEKYKIALQELMAGLQNEQQSVKDTILPKMAGYLSRAEALKAVLDAKTVGRGADGDGGRDGVGCGGVGSAPPSQTPPSPPPPPPPPPPPLRASTRVWIGKSSRFKSALSTAVSVDNDR